MSIYGILHDTAALFILACLILPFTAMKLKNSSPDEAIKRAGKTANLLRIPQFVLIVSLITGLLRTGFTFSTFLVIVMILFLGIAALLGIITKTAKTIKAQAEHNQPFAAAAQKMFSLSVVCSVLIIVMVVYKIV